MIPWGTIDVKHNGDNIFIESEDIDLIIMGTHGRSGMEHVIFGSVAENVDKKLPVPVLTINPYTLK